MNAPLLEAAALILGIVAIVESRGRSWAGWGVVCLAVALLWGKVL